MIRLYQSLPCTMPSACPYSENKWHQKVCLLDGVPVLFSFSRDLCLHFAQSGEKQKKRKKEKKEKKGTKLTDKIPCLLLFR